MCCSLWPCLFTWSLCNLCRAHASTAIVLHSVKQCCLLSTDPDTGSLVLLPFAERIQPVGDSYLQPFCQDPDPWKNSQLQREVLCLVQSFRLTIWVHSMSVECLKSLRIWIIWERVSKITGADADLLLVFPMYGSYRQDDILHCHLPLYQTRNHGIGEVPNPPPLASHKAVGKTWYCLKCLKWVAKWQQV